MLIEYIIETFGHHSKAILKIQMYVHHFATLCAFISVISLNLIQFDLIHTSQQFQTVLYQAISHASKEYTEYKLILLEFGISNFTTIFFYSTN